MHLLPPLYQIIPLIFMLFTSSATVYARCLLPRQVASGTTTTATNNNSSSAIRWVDCTTHVPFPVQAQLNITSTGTLPSSLLPLPKSLACGEIDVPMDWSQAMLPGTNQITVGFAMNRAALGKSEGLVLFHAGGPGLDAASQAWVNALNVSGAETFAGLENFDFLAVNTRGIQLSNPLNCSSGVFFNDIPFAFPSNQTEFDDYQGAVSKFIDSCVQNSSPAGIVQHVGTAEVIQDWDAIRASLGYDVVHFVGVSYGTFVGAAYAQKYPNRVGRFVLDAVLPHGMPFQDMVTDQVSALNRLLLRADAYCLADPSCPFHGQGKGSVVAAWNTLLDRAPIPAPQCASGTRPPSGLPCNSPVTQTDLRLGASVLLRANPDFPLFNRALNASLAGDASLFAYVPAADIRESVVVPLLCSDLKTDNSTFAAFEELRTNAASSDPNRMVYSQIWQFVLMCDAWPFSAPEPSVFSSDLPLMWVTSDFDLNLPTELTTFAFEHTPNSTLIIRHGDDHTSIALPNTATHALEIAFLQTGIFPDPAAPSLNQTLVSVFPPGGMRGPVPDPYSVPLGQVAGDFSTVEDVPGELNALITASSRVGQGSQKSAAVRHAWKGDTMVACFGLVSLVLNA
ncbi:unnamed protein product [Mycena citricolor]|uniref:AB hydrolase-1 domain-containing protein n=1 Tax=Mycena citricolor TaxID=2018698 RepID=A0AAD2JVC7_9AGAR|nr:unnamed protein product [Mycena citricolor]